MNTGCRSPLMVDVRKSFAKPLSEAKLYDGTK